MERISFKENDIIGKMKIRLEDELIDNIKRKYEVSFPFDDMDIIIDGCVDVANIRIGSHSEARFSER